MRHNKRFVDMELSSSGPLYVRIVGEKMVGAWRFELQTSCAQEKAGKDRKYITLTVFADVLRSM
jgi:hypothetical protein